MDEVIIIGLLLSVNPRILFAGWEGTSRMCVSYEVFLTATLGEVAVVIQTLETFHTLPSSLLSSLSFLPSSLGYQALIRSVSRPLYSNAVTEEVVNKGTCVWTIKWSPSSRRPLISFLGSVSAEDYILHWIWEWMCSEARVTLQVTSPVDV